MKAVVTGVLSAFAFAALATTAIAETKLTIATVNNGDMIRMQKLTDDFTTANPDIKLEWVTLEENVLREKVTTDIAAKGGQFDVLTIGTYEVPIWGKKGWLVPITGVDDPADLIPSISAALSVDGKLMAAPFYAESSFIMYRKDLVDATGMKMPDKPTWDEVRAIADKITNKDKEIYGICLRGKPGWGEGGAVQGALGNSFGARWFDENWKPQFDSPEWKKALTFFVDMMKADGPPGVSTNGYNETMALYLAGKCGMWIDATVSASALTDPKQAKFPDQVGFALAPDTGNGNRGNWLWAWSLAIPAGTQKADAAQKFVGWATSKHYTELVAAKEGWANVPPGTRTSLYANPEYAKVPFAKMTLDAILSVNSAQPSSQPTPYSGAQWIAIPEFADLGTTVSQIFAAALSGEKTVDEALVEAQDASTRVMTKAGYIK